MSHCTGCGTTHKDCANWRGGGGAPCCYWCNVGSTHGFNPAPDQWEPLYRAEKRRADAAEAAVARVRALCDKHEHGALRWADPLPVPEWIPLIRAALEAP